MIKRLQSESWAQRSESPCKPTTWSYDKNTNSQIHWYNNLGDRLISNTRASKWYTWIKTTVILSVYSSANMKNANNRVTQICISVALTKSKQWSAKYCCGIGSTRTSILSSNRRQMNHRKRAKISQRVRGEVILFCSSFRLFHLSWPNSSSDLESEGSELPQSFALRFALLDTRKTTSLNNCLLSCDTVKFGPIDNYWLPYYCRLWTECWV